MIFKLNYIEIIKLLSYYNVILHLNCTIKLFYKTYLN